MVTYPYVSYSVPLLTEVPETRLVDLPTLSVTDSTLEVCTDPPDNPRGETFTIPTLR